MRQSNSVANSSMTTGNESPNHRDLILHSKCGDDAALGELLDKHRDWLKNVAAKELNGRVLSRIDASDIVQQTLLSACRRIEQFEGSTSGEFAAWLGRIHEHNIQDALRRHVTAFKRSTRSEQSISSDQPLADGNASTPSHNAIRDERAEQLRTHLDALPEDQAEAVRLRHLEGWSLAHLAEHFDRSTDSVASLLKRGVENLRNRVHEE